jgi:hypothetical protein
MPQATRVLKLLELAAFETLIALHFLLELKVKRLHRISDPLDFLVTEASLLQTGPMISEAIALVCKPSGYPELFARNVSRLCENAGLILGKGSDGHGKAASRICSQSTIPHCN